LVLASLTFACKKKNEDPTIFEGKVVYADDGSPAAGAEVWFNVRLRAPFLTGYRSGDHKIDHTDERGEFRIEFPYNKEYIKMRGIVLFRGSDGIATSLFRNSEGLNCAPNNCEGFRPHQKYSNMLIKIKRP
jgi:hypothetical protein